MQEWKGYYISGEIRDSPLHFMYLPRGKSVYFQPNFTVPKTIKHAKSVMQLNYVGQKGQIPKVDHMSGLSFRLRETQVCRAMYSQIIVGVHSFKYQ